MTHPRLHAAATPDKPAVTMSDGSPGLTFGQLEARANQGVADFTSSCAMSFSPAR